jgi:hypothetical protein
MDNGRKRKKLRYGSPPVHGILDGLEGCLDVGVAHLHHVLQSHLNLRALHPCHGCHCRLLLLLEGRPRLQQRRAPGVDLLLRRWWLLGQGLLEADRARQGQVGIDVGGEEGHGLLRQLLRRRCVPLPLRLRLRLGLLHEEDLALVQLVLSHGGCRGGRGGVRARQGQVGIDVGGEEGHGLLRQLLQRRCVPLPLRLRLGLGLLHEEDLALVQLVLRHGGCRGGRGGVRGGVHGGGGGGLARGEDLGEMVGLLFRAKFVKPVLNFFGKDTPVLNLPVGCDYADTFWVKTVWVRMEGSNLFYVLR